MSDYNLTHNGVFREYIPQLLQQGFLDRFIEMNQKGQAEQFLCDVWSYQANVLFGIKSKFKKSLLVEPSQFHIEWFNWGSNRYLVTIRTPEINADYHASVVGIMFDEHNRNFSARYYTYEGTAMSGPSWTFFEYLSNGSHFNYGALGDPTTIGFQNAVAATWGCHIEREQSMTIKEAETLTSFEVNSNGEVVQFDAEVSIAFLCSWDSASHILTAEVLANLRLLQSKGGIVLSVHGSIFGLLKETMSYVQFMWLEDGSLVVEVAGDYSHDGLALPPTVKTLFENCGLTLVPEGMGNFGLVIDGTLYEEDRKKILDGIFAAFNAGLRPSGPLGVEYF